MNYSQTGTFRGYTAAVCMDSSHCGVLSGHSLYCSDRASGVLKLIEADENVKPHMMAEGQSGTPVAGISTLKLSPPQRQDTEVSEKKQ
jgi:hypothetical protein